MNPLSAKQEYTLLAFLIFAWFGVLYALIPRTVFLLCATVGIGVAMISLLPVVITRTAYKPLGARIAVLSLLALIIVPLGYTLIEFDWSVLSVIGSLLLLSLALVFLYYGSVLPMALFQLHRIDDSIEITPPYPTISIIIPAYNEEDCIEASIDALKTAMYPDSAKEVIVVDDGSTDATYQTAMRHADDAVRVLSKPNGGKHSALNYGLDYANGEIIVTIDADSLLAPDGLKRIAATFQDDEDIGAIAGNITVLNRGKLITKLQALEYVVGIELFRRAFNLTGTIVVIPGAFGAFRREILDDVGRFDGDTLTEDRDATIKVLKAGYKTRAIDARCLTEAPESWADLYKQRLRWYRGTVQTILKHRDIFHRPEFGFLYSFAFPLEAFTAFGIPIIGVVIVISIIIELLVGSVMLVISMFTFFASLQVLVSLLAVRVGGQDLRLVALAPFFVLGYRQFLDVVMIKSAIDVLSNRELSWTSPQRTGRLGDLTANGISTEESIDSIEDANPTPARKSEGPDG